LLLLDLKGDDTLEFQNIYEITFPQFSGGRPAAPNGNRTITYTVTLTTPDLPTSERERLTASYRERLKQVEYEGVASLTSSMFTEDWPLVMKK
jgi:hypothetical protein